MRTFWIVLGWLSYATPLAARLFDIPRTNPASEATMLALACFFLLNALLCDQPPKREDR